MVFKDQLRIHRISSETQLLWQQFNFVRQKEDGTDEERKEYPSMWPKIVQANSKEVYFLGGNRYDSFATKDCFILNLETNILRQIPSLKIPRYAFGSCIHNQHIYCVGGLTHYEDHLKSCERYDMIERRWEDLPDLE